MTTWPPRPGELRRPAYRSLAERLTRAIEAGELEPGYQLPPHRILADQLGLSVQTVSRAYDELTRRGLIGGEVGRGTFVRATNGPHNTPFLPEKQGNALIDCSLLKPVVDSIHRDAMRDVLASLSRDLPESTFSSFRPSAALDKYRQPVCAWLSRCDLETDPERIVLTNGSTAAMTVALMTAINPGELVLTENIGHHTLKALTGYLGMRLKGLSQDDEGILPDDLARTCDRHPARALFVMPSGLSPTAAMMSSERRHDLVALARKHDLLIIESDAWGPLHPGRPAPIGAIAPERTLYFTGFSKCVMPGLRLGCLVMPERLVTAAANRHLVTQWMATPLMAEIAGRWLADSTIDSLVRWQIGALGERNKLAARILKGLPFRGTTTGMHVWLPLPAGWTETGFVAHARLHGLAIAPGSAFMLDHANMNQGVRICLGPPDREALARGLDIIARLARSVPEPALLTI
ncbi:MAG: PLP-dependent aminotransferase family protein [Geminicoccaceae bacterium]|nr:PLP-dependent aminotransferase family protein [Geminicoccaceae bacterium]